MAISRLYKAKSSADRAGVKALEAAPKGSELNIVAIAGGKFAFEIIAPVKKVQAKKEPSEKATEASNKAKGEKRNHSSIESPCQVVWDIAEKMAGERRKDIIAACEKAGVTFYTARTQYQKYLEACRAS